MTITVTQVANGGADLLVSAPSQVQTLESLRALDSLQIGAVSLTLKLVDGGKARLCVECPDTDKITRMQRPKRNAQPAPAH